MGNASLTSADSEVWRIPGTSLLRVALRDPGASPPRVILGFRRLRILLLIVRTQSVGGSTPGWDGSWTPPEESLQDSRNNIKVRLSHCAPGSALLAPRSWLRALGSALLAPRSWLRALGSALLAPRSWLFAPYRRHRAASRVILGLRRLRIVLLIVRSHSVGGSTPGWDGSSTPPEESLQDSRNNIKVRPSLRALRSALFARMENLHTLSVRFIPGNQL